MDELLVIFPILFLIYILQCVAISPPGTTVFFVGASSRGRLLRHSWRLTENDRRLFLHNPFDCFNQAVFVPDYPLSFIVDSSGQILGLRSHNSPEKLHLKTEVSFTSPHRFESQLKVVLVDGSLIAVLTSEKVATRLAHFLNKLQSASPSKRTSIAHRELSNLFSSESIQRRLELYAKQTYLLTSFCFFLFLFIFLVAPAAIYSLRLLRVWPELLAALALSAFAILWTYRRANRALYPQDLQSDVQHLVAIALSPLAAVRAADSLAPRLLEDFHPIPAAYSVLDKTEFIKFAEKGLRKIKFIRHDFVLEKHVSTFLAKHGFDSESLLKPPVPDSLKSRAFCPACLTQFVIDEGVCLECGDVPLHPLPKTDSNL